MPNLLKSCQSGESSPNLATLVGKQWLWRESFLKKFQAEWNLK